MVCLFMLLIIQDLISIQKENAALKHDLTEVMKYNTEEMAKIKVLDLSYPNYNERSLTHTIYANREKLLACVLHLLYWPNLQQQCQLQ